GDLLHAQAAAIEPVHLERARNQLTVARVRGAERTYATMEQAVEELLASGSVMPTAEAMAMIEDIGADEVRAVFKRMLAHPCALAITGKGASARGARQLAARLAARVEPR
ncbi:MAG: insulinase family protein, partial [Comamonadaceae bacterium]